MTEEIKIPTKANSMEINDLKGENLRTAYQELCPSYDAIDDFRGKLLGFLPLATGTGIFLLLQEFNVENLKSGTSNLLAAVGFFGFLITVGLFSFEIYGIKKRAALINAGTRMESLPGIEWGQFSKRPHKAIRIINEPFASAIIYSTVTPMWAFFALFFWNSNLNPSVAILILIVGFASTLICEFHLQQRSNATAKNQTG